MKKVISFFLFIFTISFGKVVEYNIDIDYKNVNFTGKDVKAMTLNGKIPGPTLKFVEGDTLRVTFNNKMDVESSIHWHGLLLPNDQDGVPYLTTPPIKPGTSFTYEF
nr:multicopper oxidase domain-containing protein [uncultured Cetobacterium sp.]